MAIWKRVANSGIVMEWNFHGEDSVIGFDRNTFDMSLDGV